ncbi:VPLPA-CTERM sorting domain-containing protein [uncultured Albimonas sp.]|uniref:VPLPA-CTERM sorting domain-containing protein n=1 Tax=uncultured Albimonas sp. TaxID=1331701 RepID=UPI0030EC3D49|tara:strand:- start:9798 stop:10490 length:693 start_codon:yes stop_codon:yes gene_type:complete
MRSFILGAIGAVALAAAAHAAPISYTTGVDAGAEGFTGATLNFGTSDGFTVTLPQWDPTLFPGMSLISATIDWEATLNALGSYEAVTNGSLRRWLVDGFMTGTGPSSLYVELDPAGDLNPPPPTVLSLTAGDSGSLAPIEVTDDIQQIFTTGLGVFTGNSLLTWEFDGTIFSSPNTSGTITTTPTGSGSVSAVITYVYEPTATAVPLPAALPLMGASLAGLALVARRRKS